MIRVFKSPEIPSTLQNVDCSKYDGQDVQDALVIDQHCKCYLCEQYAGKSFQVEHLKPKAKEYFPELKFDWNNLFLVCSYCNGRKPNSFTILDPTKSNVEELIEQRLEEKKLIFKSLDINPQVEQTISLLSKLFNGEKGIRDVKCQQLFKDIEREINFFFKLLLDYKNNPTNENRKTLTDCLNIDKEFLGFKYWIMKDYGFFDEFSEFMVWNKSN
jgi:uncharacterized protein (TIGR02646 family)